MRRTMKVTKAAASAERAFERVLVALERELVATTDEEISEAARDLGMNLAMKGSAAFIGLKYPSGMALRDWFGADDLQRLRLEGGARATTLERPAAGALETPRKRRERDDE